MSRACLVSTLLVAALAHAAAPKPSPRHVEPVVAPNVPTPELLVKARAAVDGLEYANALVLAEALVQRGDASRAARVEGYWLMGLAVAVLRDPFEAEGAFRTLFRLDPSFEPSGDPGPKILAAFRKVQVEERTLAARLAASERARLIEGLSLTGDPPATVRGGRPARFSFRLKDPTGAVDQLKVSYRLKSSAGPFSSLGLTPAGDGQWAGEVPGELTANPGGEALEYFVEGTDAKGLLLARGDGKVPLFIELTPGNAKRGLPRKVYLTTLGATLVVAATTVGLGVAALVADRTHVGQVNAATTTDGLSSRDWTGSWVVARDLISATWVGLIATAVGAGLSIVFSRFAEPPD